jgi:hypothetical protein
LGSVVVQPRHEADCPLNPRGVVNSPCVIFTFHLAFFHLLSYYLASACSPPYMPVAESTAPCSIESCTVHQRHRADISNTRAAKTGSHVSISHAYPMQPTSTSERRTIVSPHHPAGTMSLTRAPRVRFGLSKRRSAVKQAPPGACAKLATLPHKCRPAGLISELSGATTAAGGREAMVQWRRLVRAVFRRGEGNVVSFD